MDILTRNVIYATGLRREIVKLSVGHVLLFLRDEAPEAHVSELLDKMRQAREALAAAAAVEDGGTKGAIEGLGGSMGSDRADVHILAAKLMKLGLDETQIVNLIKEIIARAESLIGADDVARIQRLLASLIERAGRMAEPMHPSP